MTIPKGANLNGQRSLCSLGGTCFGAQSVSSAVYTVKV